MKNNNITAKEPLVKTWYLPDFCHSEFNFRLVLVLELIAIIFSIVSATDSSNLFIHLALISLYIQWVGLSSAAILCICSRFSILRGVIPSTVFSLFVVCAITIVVSITAMLVSDFLQLKLFNNQSAIEVIFKHGVISLILIGLTLRYFYIQHESQLVLMTESQSRLQALQARIRPHFLFNSLNTIASLTHEQPDIAEKAIENLADLFRASLSADIEVSLQREVDLTKDYINLELLRLDDRLTINWDIQVDMEKLTMPGLILQPLVENAIYHGIEPLPEGGVINISLHQDDALMIKISNPAPKPGFKSNRKGNQMALGNVNERLLLAYQGQAQVVHLSENGLYTVIIRVPI